jgi:AcrR family transcriptional regulator
MNIHSLLFGEPEMPDRESRKKQITAKRRQQILDAALDVFARKGYTASTIPEIAKLAGLAAGTIYLYYPSKRELFVAVIESLMVIPIVNIFENETGENFKKTIKTALNERLAILQSILLTRLISFIGEIQRDPELLAIFMEKLIQPFLSRMETYYQARIDSGEFRSMEPAITVRLVGSLMLGMNLLKSIEGDASPLSRLPQSQVVDEIVNFVLHGLEKGNNRRPLAREGIDFPAL